MGFILIFNPGKEVPEKHPFFIHNQEGGTPGNSWWGCAVQFSKSGSARVLGYTVYRGFLNRVYGILQLKYGYSVYHFL